MPDNDTPHHEDLRSAARSARESALADFENLSAWAHAADSWLKAIGASSGAPEDWLYYTEAVIRAGDEETGLVLLGRLENNAPELRVHCALLKGESLERLGRHAEAEDVWRIAAATTGWQGYWGNYGLARALAAQGRDAEARAAMLAAFDCDLSVDKNKTGLKSAASLGLTPDEIAAAETKFERLTQARTVKPMDFETYLNWIPHLHSWDGGKTWEAGGFHKHELREIHDLALRCGGPDATILETGSGNSTITFLLAKPKKLISIDVEEALAERIARFCSASQIDTSAWDFRQGRSEWILPELAKAGTTIDLALIDGGHGWPSVFVDFCYVYYMLRPGGLLMIDDVQLYSVAELKRFLQKETKRFAVEKDLGKIMVFKKLTEDQFYTDWGDQPYIAERSK